ncbi:hypothetical protein, partial [Raoultella sp. 18083]|uniref:hypothetical protein n=1 Tax=Raoultella sp. 18083 TaxID=2681462 RepID=UPI0013580C1C
MTTEHQGLHYTPTAMRPSLSSPLLHWPRPAAPQRQRGRAMTWVLGVLGTLVALLLIALVILLTFDWN